MRFLYKKRAFLPVILVLCLLLAACSGTKLNSVSKELSTYTINASFDEASHTVTAHQKVNYVNSSNAPLTNIMFHLYPQAFREGSAYDPVPPSVKPARAYPDGRTYGGITIANATVGGKAVTVEIGGSDKDILILPFDTALYPTARLTVEFDFVLTIPMIHHRLGYNDETVNLGNWYPIACVYKNGGFDTSPYYNNGDPFFSEAANYNVNLSLPASYIVASSGSGKVENKASTALHTLSAKAVRDFAMVLSKDFKVAKAMYGKTQILYYFVNDEAPENSLQAAVDSVKTFSDMFGSYPYPAYSVTETSFLNGGMEYPGLVMISDYYSGDDYLEIIIHETAHQWWYSLVGNNQIYDAWMDEGLAEYSTTLFYERNAQYNVSKSARMLDTLRSYLLYTDVYKALRGQVDTSMSRRADKFEEHEYVCMVYVKGHLLFDNLRNLIGEKCFFSALKSYFKANIFTLADKELLIAEFEKASGKPLQNYFNAWLDGSVQILEL